MTIRREDFVTNLARNGGYLDTRNMSPELTRAFRDAGVSDADLRAVAGTDSVVRGAAEFDALFARIDQRAEPGTSVRTIDRGTSSSPTRAGTLIGALERQVDANRTRAASEGGARFAGEPQLAEVSAGRRVLDSGDTGEGVRRIQQSLIDMGYANRETMTMGTFDAETRRATQRFQRDAGLAVDGRVGAETLGALAATAPRPGEVLETSPEYRRLYADGRLDATIALGFDESSTHLTAERDVIMGLSSRGFRAVSTDQIRAMSGPERTRLGLDDSRLDPNARYFIRDDGRGGQDDVVVRLITPGTGGAAARASFERAMQQDEVVLYNGHARYGTGPDFDAIDSGAGNFVIDGHGNREGHHPPAGLRASIGGESRSDLRSLANRPDYQLLIFNACSTEEYAPNLRNPRVFGRDMQDTDMITTTIPTRLASGSAHTLGFLDGVMRRDSTTAMTQAQSRVEQDTLRGFGMTAEIPGAGMTYSTSGFLGNSDTRSRRP